jgi:hypothetical protein
MGSDQRWFFRPTAEDFASDEALEAFAFRVWLAMTSKEQDMTGDQDAAQPQESKDVPRAGFICGSYESGHCVHYLPVMKRARDLTPLPAALQPRGDGWLLDVEGDEHAVWNHNDAALTEVVEQLGSACDWFPTLGLARWVDGGIRHWVSLSLEPISGCASVEQVRRAEIDAWR